MYLQCENVRVSTETSSTVKYYDYDVLQNKTKLIVKVVSAAHCIFVTIPVGGASLHVSGMAIQSGPSLRAIL